MLQLQLAKRTLVANSAIVGYPDDCSGDEADIRDDCPNGSYASDRLRFAALHTGPRTWKFTQAFATL